MEEDVGCYVVEYNPKSSYVHLRRSRNTLAASEKTSSFLTTRPTRHTSIDPSWDAEHRMLLSSLITMSLTQSVWPFRLHSSSLSLPLHTVAVQVECESKYCKTRRSLYEFKG
jgi:hypothetical protein